MAVEKSFLVRWCTDRGREMLLIFVPNVLAWGYEQILKVESLKSETNEQ